MKKIVADTHVHLYPCYGFEEVFRSARTNLGRLAGDGADTVFLLFLTERSGSRAFQDLAEGKTAMPSGWQAKPLADENAFCVQSTEDQARLCVLNGRQIVTRERLELLALAGNPDVPDGEDARQVIEAIQAAGAVPVLPWAPGKWLFERGRVVEGLLRDFQPTQLLIGDTALRPAGWGEPRLMCQALDRGFKIVAGTDPLPFAGEERGIGRYGVAWNGELGEYSLVRDIRRMLLDPQCVMRTVGERGGLLTVTRRLIRLHQVRRAGHA